MSWGISPRASEKEKIKAEFADILNGYNSCCKISYSTYSELFDIGMDLLDKIYEQGKKDVIDKTVNELEDYKTAYTTGTTSDPYESGCCYTIDKVIEMIKDNE